MDAAAAGMNFDAAMRERNASRAPGSRKERTLVNWCCVLLKRLAMQLTPATRSGRQPEGCAHQLAALRRRGEFCAPLQSNWAGKAPNLIYFNTMYQIMMCCASDIAGVCDEVLRVKERGFSDAVMCLLATLFISHQPPIELEVRWEEKQRVLDERGAECYICAGYLPTAFEWLNQGIFRQY